MPPIESRSSSMYGLLSFACCATNSRLHFFEIFKNVSHAISCTFWDEAHAWTQTACSPRFSRISNEPWEILDIVPRRTWCSTQSQPCCPCLFCTHTCPTNPWWLWQEIVSPTLPSLFRKSIRSPNRVDWDCSSSIHLRLLAWTTYRSWYPPLFRSLDVWDGFVL